MVEMRDLGVSVKAWLQSSSNLSNVLSRKKYFLKNLLFFIHRMVGRFFTQRDFLFIDQKSEELLFVCVCVRVCVCVSVCVCEWVRERERERERERARARARGSRRAKGSKMQTLFDNSHEGSCWSNRNNSGSLVDSLISRDQLIKTLPSNGSDNSSI